MSDTVTITLTRAEVAWAVELLTISARPDLVERDGIRAARRVMDKFRAALRRKS